MIFESCGEIRRYFFEYLDDLCEPETLRSIRYHLSFCEACRRELDRRQAVQSDLRRMPRQRVPSEVGLRLRVCFSQKLHRNLLARFWVRLENGLRPLLLPVSGGVSTAVICLGLIMGLHVVPTTNAPDVPLQIATPPRVRALGAIDLNTGDQAVVVVTQVSAEGRVMRYQVLSGQHSPELMHRLDRVMYFSLFKPATMFGIPTNGQVVLSLRHITVRG